MAPASLPDRRNSGPRLPLWRDPRARGLFWQGLLALNVVLLFAAAGATALANMRARGIPVSFDFLGQTAEFDIDQRLLPYASTSTYGRALTVGFANTLLVSVLSCVFATLIGVALGFARLSDNWAVARLAAAYVVN